MKYLGSYFFVSGCEGLLEGFENELNVLFRIVVKSPKWAKIGLRGLV